MVFIWLYFAEFNHIIKYIDTRIKRIFFLLSGLKLKPIQITCSFSFHFFLSIFNVFVFSFLSFLQVVFKLLKKNQNYISYFVCIVRISCVRFLKWNADIENLYYKAIEIISFIFINMYLETVKHWDIFCDTLELWNAWYVLLWNVLHKFEVQLRY